MIDAPQARQPDDYVRSGVTFRLAVLADVEALVPIINEAYMREAWLLPPPRTTQEELAADLALAEFRLMVAELDGELVGSIGVWLRDEGPFFGLFAVAPAFQGRGLASILVGQAEQVARDAGFSCMRLECAKELGLPPYYESLGYHIEREEVGIFLGSVEPITLTVMKKDLP